MAVSPACGSCNDLEESSLHCLRECDVAKDVWSKLGFWDCGDFRRETTTSSWISNLCSGPAPHLFLAGVWWIWLWRNNRIFSDKSWSASEVVRWILNSHDDFASAYPTKFNSSLRLSLRWQPPPPNFMKLNTDGSFIPSSGLIGSGGLLRNCNGSWIHGFSCFDATGDVLLAELMGLYHGLSLANDLQMKLLVCESDSLDVVTLVNNRAQHQFHDHAPLLVIISQLLDSFDSVSLVHCVREQNSCADFLAKKGVSSSGFQSWSSPPDGLGSLLLRDELSV